MTLSTSEKNIFKWLIKGACQPHGGDGEVRRHVDANLVGADIERQKAICVSYFAAAHLQRQ